MGKKIRTNTAKKKAKFNLLKTDDDLPKEILSNSPQIVLIGEKSALIEGNVSIVEYDDSVVKIAYKSGYTTFFGEELSINAFSENKISFVGKISSIEFS